MGRPPLPVGTWGDISVTGTPGNYRASARYRGPDGHTRTYSRFRKTKGAARDELLKFFAGKSNADRTGELLPESAASMLLKRWIELWESAKDRPPSTVRTYRRAVDLATEQIGGLRIMECSTGRLDAAVSRIAGVNGAETARQVRNVLRQAFADAVRLDLLTANPALGTAAVRNETKEVRVLLAGEAEKLRAAARAWEQEPTKATRPWRRQIAASIDVLLGTGVRVGELLAIRWVDVDLNSIPATVEVAGTVTRSLEGPIIRQDHPKSERSQRTLYLPQFATEALRAHRDAAMGTDPDDPVFPSQMGSWRDPSGYRKDFRAVRGMAGLGWVTPHSLRKTVATAVYREKDLRNAGGQLGHSEYGVTSRHYIEQVNAGPKEVVGIMDDWLESAS